MSEENVELVRGAYDDFNSGNPQGVLARCDASVEWTEPGGGNSPSGTFTGPESVGNDVFSKIPENFDEFSAQPEDFKDDGDGVVVTGTFKGKSKSGVELDAPFTHTYEIKDGKVTKLNNEVGGNWVEAWGG
jgi:ketosteroid isomerase-like protein